MPSNDLTPATSLESASAFHAVSWVEVQIDPNPKNGEVYKQGSKGYGEDKTDYYALSNVALSRLMNAAGIEAVSSIRTDDRSNPNLCSWQFNARYVQPDSTVLNYPADYELDLRDYIPVNGNVYKGARFEKALVDEREALMYADNKKAWGNLWGDSLSRKADEAYRAMSEDDKKKYDDAAEGKALKFVTQMRQFIVQRAQTGAMERAIRKMLNLKSAYTLAELKNPFRVPRSRFDWDRLDKAIGKDAGQELRQLEAMKVLGIDVSTYQQFKQLNAPAQSRPQVEIQIPTQTVLGEAIQTPEVVEGVVSPVVEISETKAPELSFHGVEYKSLDDVVGSALQSEPLRSWYKTNIVDKLKPQKHYQNHLTAHFGKSSAVNLTWKELIVLDAHVNDSIEYPEEYHPTEKKAKKETKVPAGDLESRIESSGIGPILSGLKLDKTNPEVVRVLEDMIHGVQVGAFDPNTDEGKAEIETYLEQEIH